MKGSVDEFNPRAQVQKKEKRHHKSIDLSLSPFLSLSLSLSLSIYLSIYIYIYIHIKFYLSIEIFPAHPQIQSYGAAIEGSTNNLF